MTVWEEVLAAVFDLRESHESLHKKVDAILAKENQLSDQQAELDADTQTLIGLDTTISANVSTGLTEVAALQAAIAAGTPPAQLDFSGLETALGNLQTASTGVSGLVAAAAPAAPATPPASS